MIGVAIGGILSVAIAHVATRAQVSPRLTADAGHFRLDGAPVQILSGEMHYPRVPREYWRDRFRKARAMGLNTISTYVFWNLHEPAPGRFDFSGNLDVAEFIREAGAEGLHVIVRPGPYVCAEWELGGYPAWLLADPAMVLRSTDSRFTAPAERWLMRLGKELSPLIGDRRNEGAPIIAVQVENEYGSFDKDRAYMEWQRDALRRAGVGRAMLYTADGDVQLPNGTLPDLPAVVNFGTGGAENAFKRLEAFRPGAPLMTGEYWAGWFDQWGRPHASTNVDRQTRELSWMLERGYSINLYMFHGGTTFGFMNGANIDRNRYLPQTSSYDYDAALSESGRPTAKYDAFRAAIAAHLKTPLPPVPASDPPIAVAPFALQTVATIWQRLGTPVRTERPRSMETFGQSYGYILYRTTMPEAGSGELTVSDVRDYAQVYLDGRLAGTLDRRLAQTTIAIEVPRAGARLDLLVENSGRVNFAKPLRDERKGITKSVTFRQVELTGWDVFTLGMSAAPAGSIETTKATGVDSPAPAFYRGTFTIAAPGDTFLDTRGWGKGTVWVNGHHLGRFWDIGPQQTLYVPGPWLRRGRNVVDVFTLAPPSRDKMMMNGVAAPIFSRPQ
jgi:beta-galactosidase